MKGIDVSSYQGLPDWQKVKAAGIEFAILRCHQRYGIDASFEHNYKGCRDNGIPVGVYKYSYATNEDEAREEAAAVLEVLKGKLIDLPVFLDLEDDSQVAINQTKLESIALAFLNTISGAGYEVGVYCNKWWYNNKLTDKLKEYYLWIAAIPSDDKGEIVESLRPEDAKMWQYSWEGSVDGIAGKVDMNVTQEPVSVNQTEAAIRWMEALAADPSHGYDQIYRWGEKGDYDCSSATITAWELAGVPVKTKGATYTGNMRKVFVTLGFLDVTDQVNLATGAGLVRGDVLLNEVHHVAMYVGDGKEVEASINEKSTATGGTPGDQTGREILVRSYRNYPWDCVLRYVGSADPARERITLTVEEIRKGDSCQSVWILRTILRGRSYKTQDGKLITRSKVFDDDADYCVRVFQKKHKLDVDGIVGKNTWTKLTGL